MDDCLGLCGVNEAVMMSVFWSHCTDMCDTRPATSPRLVIPHAARHAPSLSHAPSGTQSPSIQPATGLESSASSVINLDLSDGILVHDVDAEVETATSEETTAVGQNDDVADEESRKNLRVHLRRTLNKKEHTGIPPFYLPCPYANISRSQHPYVCAFRSRRDSNRRFVIQIYRRHVSL